MSGTTVNIRGSASCWGKALALLLLLLPMQADATGAVLLLDIKGAIGPASSDYVQRGLARAEAQQATLVILRLDTPGGLDAAMRDIIHDILAAPQPVVSFVAPGGARAASAGTYILYASHVAAMAPGTNLGAATPVQIGAMPGSGKSPLETAEKAKDKDKDAKSADNGDAMQHKMVNDAVAYIRSLAQLRGRNADWAEQAVRTAASLPAEEALKKNVIDLIAADVPELLAKLDGRKLTVLGTRHTLSTKGLTVETLVPDWRNRLLAVITDPNVAYILMLIGIYGLFFEFANPGFVLPGVAGAICLVLALYAFQVLPVNYAGLGLILLGIMFMTAEAFVPSFGALGLGGVIAFAIGSVILFDTGAGGFAVSYTLIGSLTLLSALFFVFVVGMALKARRRPVVSGSEELPGMIGEALEDFTGAGRIRIHGESWQARCEQPVRRGQQLRVTGRDGLTLVVQPLTKEH